MQPEAVGPTKSFCAFFVTCNDKIGQHLKVNKYDLYRPIRNDLTEAGQNILLAIIT